MSKGGGAHGEPAGGGTGGATADLATMLAEMDSRLQALQRELEEVAVPITRRGVRPRVGGRPAPAPTGEPAAPSDLVEAPAETESPPVPPAPAAEAGGPVPRPRRSRAGAPSPAAAQESVETGSRPAPRKRTRVTTTQDRPAAPAETPAPPPIVEPPSAPSRGATQSPPAPAGRTSKPLASESVAAEELVREAILEAEEEARRDRRGRARPHRRDRRAHARAARAVARRRRPRRRLARPGAASAAALRREERAYEGAVTVEAGPFDDVTQLKAFEDALASVPGVEEVYIRTFERYYAHFALHIAEPTLLIAELRARSADPLRVIDATRRGPRAWRSSARTTQPDRLTMKAFRSSSSSCWPSRRSFSRSCSRRSPCWRSSTSSTPSARTRRRSRAAPAPPRRASTPWEPPAERRGEPMHEEEPPAAPARRARITVVSRSDQRRRAGDAEHGRDAPAAEARADRRATADGRAGATDPRDPEDDMTDDDRRRRGRPPASSSPRPLGATMPTRPRRSHPLELALRYGLRYSGLRDVALDPRLLLYVPLDVCEREMVLPLGVSDESLELATASPDPDLEIVRGALPGARDRARLRAGRAHRRTAGRAQGGALMADEPARRRHVLPPPRAPRGPRRSSSSIPAHAEAIRTSPRSTRSPRGC